MSARRVGLLGGVAAIIGLPAAAFAQQAIDPTPVSTPAAIGQPPQSQNDDIIVTAERRPETLQNTPISVSVVDGRKLDQSTGTGLTQILNTIPAVATTVDFQSGGTQIAVRGVSAAGPTFSGAGTVSYYLDGNPFGFVRSAIGPDLNPYDLSRVEILRGPQGTLYGAGGLNGVVRVLTNDPDLTKFEAKARAGLSDTRHGGLNYGGDFAINVPIIADKLAVRIVAGIQHYSGWIDSVSRENTNDAKLQNYRIKVAAQPTERLTVGLSYWRNDNQYGAPSRGNSAYFSKSLLPEPISSKYDSAGLKIGYEFDGFTLNSQTSYLNYKSTAFTDLNPVGLPNFRGATNLKSRLYTQELDLASSGDSAFSWSAGLFYRNARDVIFQPFYTPGAILNFADSADKSESWAAYGELSERFAGDKLKVTAGLRYFHDDAVTQALSPSDLGPVSLAPFNATFKAWTPRIILQWFPTSRETFYASYSQGFRSGVIPDEAVTLVAPTFPPANPDRLHNFEVGAKGKLFDNAVNFNAAVFYIDWRNVQQVVETPVGNGVYVGAIVNGASASGLGAEVSASARLANRLRASATFSWNNLTLDKNVLSGGFLLFDKGQRLNYSAKYTAGGSIDYTLPVNKDLSLTWSNAVNYTSPQSTTSLRGSSRVSLEGDETFSLNTRLMLETADHRISGSLFIDNVSDNNGVPIRSASTRFFDLRVRPRTLGLQIEYRM